MITLKDIILFLQVVGDTSGPILGTHLKSLLEKARRHKKEMGDDFLSVEHLLLGFLSDSRFGQQLFNNLQLSEKNLKDAVSDVRGNQRVTDQSTFHALVWIISNMVYIFFNC